MIDLSPKREVYTTSLGLSKRKEITDKLREVNIKILENYVR